MDADHGRALCDLYEQLRALVLAGALHAPGLAVMRAQGMWAWLRLAVPVTSTVNRDVCAPTAANPSASPLPSSPSVKSPMKSAAKPVQTQQLAQIWAQMVLGRPLSFAASAFS